MLDLAYLSQYRVLPDPTWEGAIAAVYSRMERAAGVRHVVKGFRAPTRPVLYATNSTQKYDFMTFRSVAWTRGLRTVTVTKAKNYHSPVMRPVLEHTGVVALASRGYVMLVDAVQVLRRRPDEDEYRALRDHLDGDVPLPATRAFDALQSTPRVTLGVPYEPSRRGLRDHWRAVYHALLGEALRHARTAVEHGYSIQMYPEGTVSSRLGAGRIGLMQFARALSLDVCPVGMSGCRDVYRGASPLPHRGTATVRFGEAYTPDLTALPAGFEAFNPAHEALARPVLQRATDDLMHRLDALLDPAQRRQEGHRPDGTQGTRRFL